MSFVSKVSSVIAALAAALAFSPAAQALPFSEVTGPADAPGAVLVIHGGGWVITGPDAVAATRPLADRFNDRWRVVSTTYARGAAALGDVLAAYDTLAAQYPRVCVAGMSAGGHLALMIAAHRDVACVVSEAGPTRLIGGTTILTMAVSQAFGYDKSVIEAQEPIRYAYNEPILAGYGTDDAFVPQDHAVIGESVVMPGHHAMPADPVPPGMAWFVHSVVDAGALDAFRAREREFVAAALTPPAPPVVAAPAPAPAPAPAVTPEAPAADAEHKRGQRCAKAARQAKGKARGRGGDRAHGKDVRHAKRAKRHAAARRCAKAKRGRARAGKGKHARAGRHDDRRRG